uniref:Proteasome subunit beta n=1 Tax=Ditylenchus dipsaci TaxID=166011 RepID=A0A915DV45_9BILA
MDGFFREAMLDSNDFKNTMHKVAANPPWMQGKLIERQRWNPYSMEGGSTAAVAGENFVVSVSDTRMSQFEVNILTRTAEKIHILSDTIILNTTGFYGDVLQLIRVLQARLHKYKFDYRHEMTVDFAAELLSRNLYYKRFFRMLYYTGAVLCGIDEFGKGAVFSYDPIGCIERLTYSCSGAASPILEPFLDNQVGLKTLAEGVEKPKLTIERATALLKDAFRFATERETSTGDSLMVVVAEAGKPIQTTFVALRED